MNLTCPGCAGRYSIDAWLNDDAARETIAAALSMPAPLDDLTLRYLALFRPKKSALSWPRARKLLIELMQPIAAGQVERNGRSWPAPLEFWKHAMEDMLNRRHDLDLPMKSHGYLFDIVASQANRAESRHEGTVEQRRRTGQHRNTTVDRTAPEAAQKHIASLLTTLKGNSSNEPASD